MPPVSSLPSVIAPHGPSNRLFQMTTFCVGVCSRRPSVSRPDLIAMLSSPARSVLFLMTTWSQDSGSQPSVFEPAWLVVTPSTVTFAQSVGCSCQNCELRSVTPWISTVSEAYGSTKLERSLPVTTRCEGGRPTSGSRTPARSCPLFQELVLEASRVPPPVSPMLLAPLA